MRRLTFLVAVMAVVGAACTPDVADTTAAATQTTAQAATTEAAVATTAATGTTTGEEATTTAGALDLGVDRIGIGIISPFTGPFGFLGVFQQNSVQAEVDRINAAGGLGGAELYVENRDMELDPARAVQGAEELAADENIHLIMGPVITGFYNAAKGILEENQKVNCQAAVGGPDALFDEQGNLLTYAFRNQDPDQFRVQPVVEYLVNERDVQSIGVVYENDDTGNGYDVQLQELAEEVGFEYAGIQYTRPDDQTHNAAVEPLLDADAIIVSNQSGNAAKTAVAAEDLGYEGILAGFSGLQGFTYVEGAGDAAEGTVIGSNYLGYFTETPPEEWPAAYRDHVEAVIEQYGETTGPNSGVKQYNGTALTADCVVLFAKAVEAAGSLDPDAVATAWESLDVPAEEMPSAVHAVFSADDHEAYGPEDIYMYEWTKLDDGRWVLGELQAGQQ
jgi:branched-chain amino acid transport system substrate-binding protein